MKFLNNRIAGEFLKDHNKVLGTGLDGKPLLRADMWLNKEALQEDGVTSRFDENVNYLETNPQIFVVSHSSANHDYLPGDKLFVNYMAFEWMEKTEHGEVIDTDFIMFQIMPDDTFKMVDGFYLGEQQYTPEEIRPSGIFIGGGKKEGLKVKITHIPEKCPKWHKEHPVKVGDMILTVDEKNYELNYWGKRYIKLVLNEIVGILEVA